MLGSSDLHNFNLWGQRLSTLTPFFLLCLKLPALPGGIYICIDILLLISDYSLNSSLSNLVLDILTKEKAV